MAQLNANQIPAQVFEKIDEYIRNGQGASARNQIRACLQKRVHRDCLARLSNLARRASLPLVSLRLLIPLVRPTGKKAPEATAEEKAEYAAALTYIGAAEEAERLLETVSPIDHPEALLFHAFLLFNSWNYEDSIPLLTRYTELARISPYQRLVGRVNLAAALTHEKRFADAEPILKSVISDAAAGGHRLLLGNSQEISAQAFLFQDRFNEARKFLDDAEKTLHEMDGYEKLYVAKWRAVLGIKEKGPTEVSLGKLARVRRESEERQLFETVRDCDRFRAIFGDDTELLRLVYFGSPYPKFRESLLKERPFKPGTTFERMFIKKKEKLSTLDIPTGVLISSGNRLKPGQLLHRLLKALASDFYRPARVAVAHYALYPDEFYNPTSSPPRVHEAVRRLRQWLLKNHFPLEIEERRGFYRLHALSPCAVRVELSSHHYHSPWMSQIEAHFSRNAFSAEETAKALRISARSAQRVLQELVLNGYLERTGKARAVRYHLNRDPSLRVK